MILLSEFGEVSGNRAARFREVECFTLKVIENSTKQIEKLEVMPQISITLKQSGVFVQKEITREIGEMGTLPLKRERGKKRHHALLIEVILSIHGRGDVYTVALQRALHHSVHFFA